MQGNHDGMRIERFENSHPEIFPLFTLAFNDLLESFNITSHPYGALSHIEEVAFTHIPFTTMGKPMGGILNAHRVAAAAHSDIVYGHTHKTQLATIPRIGEKLPRIALDLGCALPYLHIEPFAQHSQTGWTYGIWYLEVEGPHIVSWRFVSMKELEENYS